MYNRPIISLRAPVTQHGFTIAGITDLVVDRRIPARVEILYTSTRTNVSEVFKSSRGYIYEVWSRNRPRSVERISARCSSLVGRLPLVVAQFDSDRHV